MAPNMNLISLEKYDPVHQYEKMSDKMKQRKDFDLNVIKLFYVKVGLLFRHVSVFSWLDHVWFHRFAKTGVVSDTDKVMTKVIFQCYLQIDRGVRFKREDPLDPNAVLTNREKREWRELDGLTGCSIEDFNNTNRSPDSSFKKQFGKRIVNAFMDTFFTPLENYISDFYARFIRKLSEHNMKSLIEGYVGSDRTNHSTLATIPHNFGRERWELLWDHIFDKSSDFKTALINCPKLTIFNMTELAKPPEAKVASKPKPPETKVALKPKPAEAKVASKRKMNSQENSVSKKVKSTPNSNTAHSSSIDNQFVRDIVSCSIPWSFTYRDEGSKTIIKATNTCSLDTVLQMLYCMWARRQIPHQIIEDCEPILSKSFSLIKEGNHAYARVLFINDALERCTDELVKKTVSTNNDGSHSETWDCWGNCLWYTQDTNKLFKTGEFKREYGECELGPNCPKHQKYVKDSLRKYKDKRLLPDDFPISGLQDAINRFLFKKECSYPFIESGGPVHLSTRAVKYDLNFTSLPWILSVPVKQGKRCDSVSEIDFELQLMNVNFILSAIIWGDGKTHFAGISVDMNKERHIFYDGMAKQRMVILQHNQSLVSYWGRPLQLWYVKKAEQTPSNIQVQSENIPPTINVIRQPIGLTNLGTTCYLNALIQMVFSFTPIQRSIMQYSIASEIELAKAMNKTMTFFGDGEVVEVSSLQLANGLVQLKTLFEQMQVGDQPAKYLDTRPLVEALGLSPDVQQCSHEMWTNLFEFYLDFLGLQHYYTFKTNTITREVKTAERDDSEPRKCVLKDELQTNLMFCFHTPNKKK